MCLHNRAAPARALVVLKGVRSWLQHKKKLVGTLTQVLSVDPLPRSDMNVNLVNPENPVHV